MKSMLSLSDVSYVYHTKRGETHALDHVSFDVAEGEFYGIVGPSGSGKTTLLSVLAGVLKPTSGKVSVDGKEGTLGAVGYMLQRDQLLEWRTIRKNVLLGLEINRSLTPDNLAYADNLLKKYGLHEFSSSYPHELSGGMRQRAALIRTLVLRPKVVLLDEPFSALDFQTRLSVGDDVHRIIKAEGLTAVLVTHDISEAIALCDKVAVLTPRPATVKSVFDIDIAENHDTLARRDDPEFAKIFKRIWKELEVHEEEIGESLSPQIPTQSTS